MSFEQPIRLQREGIGNVNYQFPNSGGGGGAVTDANSGTSLSGTVVQLGQPAGTMGNPAKLLHETEIPLNGFNLSFNTQPGAAIHISPPGDPMLQFDAGTTGQQPMILLTIQGKNPAPLAPYGNFQIGWLDQSFTNPDGQIDAVMSTGYNTNGSDGKENTSEASFATVLESHFQQGGIGDGNFEWYLTTDSIAGTINRHLFMVIDKVVGTAVLNTQLDQWTFNTTTGNALPNFTYASLSPNGLSLEGPTMTFSISTPTPALDGAIGIFPQTGSNGKTVFVDESGSSIGFFQFNAAVLMETSNFADGFSNFWFQSSAAAGNSNGFVFVNTHFDPNAPIFQIYNNGNIATYQNAFFGNLGSNFPNPTARVHIAGGSGTPGTGSLKLVPGTLAAVPEDGLIEYDGTNFYKTIGATRTIIL